MSTPIASPRQTAPRYCQLALPGLSSAPPSPRPLPAMLSTVRPQQVWAGLSPVSQQQIRQTMVHIIQEVLNDQS
jgi:hypothetical protein